MNVNGLACTLNMPNALKTRKDADGNEISQGLPPYAPRSAYVVDEYESCPDNWMHGNSKSSSYFVGIEEGKGMWLDFNQCNNDEYDVAAVISIQGVNSITGQKTDNLGLEKYESNCPIHNEEFGQDRFCSKCKFKWPAQNYLSTTGTPHNSFWLDGFRTPDGKVRQYIFTEEQARGVAANTIGEDRVFAIGIAFYRSKSKKKNVPYLSRSYPLYSKDIKWNNEVQPWSTQDSYCVPCSAASATLSYNSESPSTSGVMRASTTRSIEPKKLEVAAGAQITQEVHSDPENLDYWNEEPAGFIYINYCSQDDVEKITSQGKREEIVDGFLAGIPTGN
jgi:hypothetical protein